MNGFEVRETRPGYLSLAIDQLKDNEGIAQEIRARFSPIRGIHRIDIDHVQGLLTVSFNYQQLTSLFSLLALKEAFTAVFPEMRVGELASFLSANLHGE